MTLYLDWYKLKVFPNEYVFGIINVLNELQMLRDNVDPQEHHRIVFDNQKGVIVVAKIHLYDVPEITEYPYSKDLLGLLTQDKIKTTDTAKKQYLSILDKCLEDVFEFVRGHSLEEE